MLQPRQHDLLACLFDLACEEYFVKYSIDLCHFPESQIYPSRRS